MTVVHITTDYPDAFDGSKTPAIQRLIKASKKEFDHCIYSLNRIDVSPLAIRARKIVEIARDDGLVTLTYQAPAKGLFLKRVMQAVGDYIAEDLVRQNITPKLVMGHKLSMEGIAAQRVGERLNSPFGLSLQGNSDRTITNVRRDLGLLYGRIFHDAAVVFPFAPWAYQHFADRFRQRAAPTIMLPCILTQEEIIAPRETESRVMSAFHLRNWKLKNLPALTRAAHALAPEIGGLHFDIYGGGTDFEMSSAMRAIGGSSETTIRLQGPIDGNLIQTEMNASAAFAMLSHKESFGMVFVEALLAGCPVIYPANSAIDGYFGTCDFAVSAPADDQGAINEAIRNVVQNQIAIKRALAMWQESGDAVFFQKEAIVDRFKAGLRIACKPEK